jgi:hypothetical protein
MSIPVSTLTLSAFLGSDQSKSSVLLSDLYSPGGSENLYIDKLGRIRTILGYTALTASPLTTDTGGSGGKIVALFPYRKTAAGAFTRHIMAVIDDGSDEWELWYSTNSGVTFTFIVDLGSGSVGAIPSFIQFGDELTMVNGVTTARVWDGSNLTAAGATVLSAPTLTLSVAGPLSGTFLWKIVPRKTNGTRKPASATSAVAQITDKQATVDWVADSDSDVGGYEVYRTSGSGAVFFYIDFVDGRTTVTYVDTLPDTELVGRRILSEHGDAPPTGCYQVTQHKGRVWYGRTDTFPRRVWHADPGDADSVYVDENYIDLTEGEDMGDVLTAIEGDHEGMLVGFLERAVFTISGTGEAIGDRLDWRKKRTNARQGSASGRCVAKVPKGARYSDDKGTEHETSKESLAYFTPVGDIRLFGDNTDIIISQGIKDRISSFNYAHRNKVWVYTDLILNHIIWHFPESGETECSAAVAWDFQRGSWHYWSNLPFAHGTVAETATAAQLMVTGEASSGVGANVYQFKSGTTHNGTTFSHKLRTKPLWPRDRSGFPIFSQMTRQRYLDLLFEKDTSPDNMIVGWMPYDATDTDPVTGSTSVIGSGRVHISVANTLGSNYHAHAARYEIITVGGTGWIMVAGELGYQLLKGRKRIA